MDNFNGRLLEENQSCDEYESSSQELTDLMPMQPLDESTQDIIDKENYGSFQTVSERPDVYEDEVYPAEYVTYEVLQPVRIPSESTSYLEVDEQEIEEMEIEETPKDLNKDIARKRHTQEEIINKLMGNQISFSDVPGLLEDDDGEDSDLETVDVSAAPIEEDPLNENHAAEFEKELNEQQRFHLKRKSVREKRRRRRLPAALHGLMGLANLNFANQKHEEAIKMCMEIIRQYPHSHEPYHTLGTIYEEENELDKAMQFYLIAAFLSPGAEIWEKLAELSITQLKDDRQAVFCLGRAIRANPQHLDYHRQRCKILERLGERTKALKGYIHMVKFLRPDQGKEGLNLAKEIAQMHYKNGDVHLAQEALETAFKKHPKFVTAGDVNLMLEVLMHREQYLTCVEVLVQHMGLVLHSNGFEEEDFCKLALEYQVLAATSCIEPENLAMDLRVKLAIAFIHLNKLELASPIITDLMEMSVDDLGDFFFDVSEAYSKTHNSEEAVPLLEALVSSDLYSKAAVWLLYGKCLVACKRPEDAADAYRKVIELAPQSGEPRLTLSGILQSLGRNEEALTVLEQEPSSEDPLDTTFLFQKCQILLEHNQTEEFISTAKLFFTKDFVNIKSREEAEAVLSIKKISSKFEAIRELRKGKEQVEEEKPLFIGAEIAVEKQWELFKELCSILCEKKRFVELQRLTFSSLTSRELMRDKDRSKEMEFLCLLSCIYNESFYFAFNIMREIILKFPDNDRAWNVLCYIISKADDFRHNRFLLRLVHKHPDNTALSILNGHNCLVSGTYKFSVAEYCLLYKNGTDDPMIPLMLGITYTHMACQKFSGNKNYLVVTADAFLQKYLEMRNESQEAYYNLGRAMHQLSLFTHAVHYYKKALNTPPVFFAGEVPDLDLKREIAFNLSLIYRKNDVNLAKYYLKRYARYD